MMYGPDSLIARIGGRKIVVAVLSIILSFMLALLGKLSGEWVAIILGVLGIFSAGNFGEHMASREADIKKTIPG